MPTTKPKSHSDLLTDLISLGRECDQKLDAYIKARQQLDRTIREAVEAGIPVTDVAETAEISRPTVYKSIERARTHTTPGLFD